MFSPLSLSRLTLGMTGDGTAATGSGEGVRLMMYSDFRASDMLLVEGSMTTLLMSEPYFQSDTGK